MDGDLAGRNREALERLRVVGTAISEQEFREPIDPPWTAAALFAHLAFWERFTRARWRETRDPQSGVPVAFDDVAMELVNDAALPGWLAVAPADAFEQCLDAAEEMDEFLISVEPDVASRVMDQGRPRLVDRSIHRNEHLDTIMSAFDDRFST